MRELSSEAASCLLPAVCRALRGSAGTRGVVAPCLGPGPAGSDVSAEASPCTHAHEDARPRRDRVAPLFGSWEQILLGKADVMCVSRPAPHTGRTGGWRAGAGGSQEGQGGGLGTGRRVAGAPGRTAAVGGVTRG